MDPKKLQALMAYGQVAQLVMLIGLPAVQKIVEQFQKNTGPTLGEIQDLATDLTPPKEFFSE